MTLTHEHIHVMLNHFPIIGFTGLCVLLIYSLIRREKHTLYISLGGAAVLALITSIVMWTGEEGMMNISSAGLLNDDAAGEDWMHEHEARAELAAIVAYITGGLALLGAVLLWKKPALRQVVAGVLLIGCLLTSGLMVYVSDAGGKIRHPEFRAAPDSAPEADAPASEPE